MNQYYKENNHSHFCDINQFADLTKEEFAKSFIMKTQPMDEVVFNNHSNVKKIKKELLKTLSMEVPASFDWRQKGAIGEVKDQGQNIIGEAVSSLRG